MTKKNESHKRYWEIATETSGTSLHPANEGKAILDINGLVIDGELSFTLKSKLSKEATDLFFSTFQQKLKEVIHHTTHQSRSYLTASDVSYVVSQEYLDRLQQSKKIEGVYLANSLQQGFIYHALKQGDVDDAYRIQLIFRYHQSLNLLSSKEAWISAQKRYGTLRLRFAWEEELVQVIDMRGDWIGAKLI